MNNIRQINIDELYKSSSNPFEVNKIYTLEEIDKLGKKGIMRNELVNIVTESCGGNVKVLNGSTIRHIAFIIDEVRYPLEGFYSVK